MLNQVLVRVVPPDGDADAATQEALRLVQEERRLLAWRTRWHGMDAMRISVSNWSTTEEDIDRSADSIIRAVRTVITHSSRPAAHSRAGLQACQRPL